MVLLVATGGAAHAQVSDVVAQAAATIVPEVVARHLMALTADSLRDRATPSPGLERAAAYVAAEFQRLGLAPGVHAAGRQQAASWFQRYAVPGQRRAGPQSLFLLMSQLERGGKAVLDESGETDPSVRKLAWLTFERDAYFAPEAGPQTVARSIFNVFAVDPFGVGKPLVVVAGRQSVAAVRQVADQWQDKTVLYIPAAGVDSTLQRQLIAALYQTSGRVLILSTADSAAFVQAATAAQRQALATVVEDYLRYATGARSWPWAAWIRAAAIQGFLEAAGIEVAALRMETQPVVRTVPSTVVLFNAQAAPLPPDSVTAPNVVGVLEGSDSVLKRQYVVLAAHLDNRIGRDGSTADTADNTAGIAVLLALAEAFSQPSLRPARSVLFLATSGGAEDWWGANRFAEHGVGTGGREWEDIAADLTLDHLDRAGGDTVLIDGLQEVDLPMSPAWVAAAHPELGLTIVDGGTAAQPSSDHFAFVREAIPSLYFHTGRSMAPLGDARAAGPADAERLARVARLVFHVGAGIATAVQRPRWNQAGHAHINSVLDVEP